MHAKVEPILKNLTSGLLGTDSAAELLLTGLLAEGHVLIQGPPGTGKTSLAKLMAQSIDCVFRRIQFTPDLLPADVVGFTMYNQNNGAFEFHKGSVFGHIVLADEINRSSPRVQSGLLECMNERQVTVDGQTHTLERPFMVMATRNRIESSGTFPLPDSQLDRFLLSFDMPQPDTETQIDILEMHAGSNGTKTRQPVITRDELLELIKEAQEMMIGRSISTYIISLHDAIQNHPDLRAIQSSRPSIGLMQAARAYAFIQGDEAVFPDHIKRIMPHVFRHRLTLTGRHAQQVERVDMILEEILQKTPVPMGTP